MNTEHDTVPVAVAYGVEDIDGDMLEVRFSYSPGSPASGHSGPPENYDPGSGDEFDIIGVAQILPDGSIAPFFTTRVMDERIADYLDEYWERPDYAAERAEYLYEQWKDDRLSELRA